MCETPLLLIKVIYFSETLLAFFFTFLSKPLYLKPSFILSKSTSSCNLLKASLFYCHLNIIQLNQNLKINLCPRINLIDPASNQISNHLEDQRLFTNNHGKHLLKCLSCSFSFPLTLLSYHCFAKILHMHTMDIL